ncbi:MAG: YkgJ family cysteine cluster protein [Phycisphaerae bacterium]|nr:YkgJ family cysteine cluster protein [Phycisphaerae bacterium]
MSDDSAQLMSLVRRLTDEQREVTRRALSTRPRGLPVLQIAPDAAQRADAAIDASPDRARQACRAGCSACCHLAVAITIPEAIWIATRLRSERTPQHFDGAVARIADHARRVGALTIEARARARVPCALLGDDGACTIHPFRPLGCRGYTSFSKELCDAALAADEPGHDGPLDATAWAAAGAIGDGLKAALREADLDDQHYEFHSALLRAIETPDAEARWSRGEDVFSDLPRVVSERLARR